MSAKRILACLAVFVLVGATAVAGTGKDRDKKQEVIPYDGMEYVGASENVTPSTTNAGGPNTARDIEHVFGYNTAVTSASFENVWTLSGAKTTSGTVTTVTKISSSNNSDTATVRIWYLDGSMDRQYIDIVLAGQTETSIGTASVLRVQKAAVITGSVAGDVYVYDDDTVSAGVPATQGKIFTKVTAGDNHSVDAFYTVPDDEQGVIKGFHYSCPDDVQVKFQYRLSGEAWYTLATAETGAEGGNGYVPFDAALVLPEKTDVQILASAITSDSVRVTAGFTVVSRARAQSTVAVPTTNIPQ